jgi:HEAT repeat protein
LATTFHVLAKTDNGASIRALIPALNSSRVDIQEGALVALLGRREPAGQREILSRISNLPHHWKKLILQNIDRMTGMLRSALLEPDESLCMNACRAAVMFEDYDVIPALLSAMENGSPAKAGMAAETLMQLTVQLYDDLHRPREHSAHHDPQWTRRHVLASLEYSVQRFGRHRRREVMEAFLLLANRENAVLNRILANPHHLGYLIIIDVFAKSDHGAVMRLLSSFLETPQAPSAVLGTIANRSDPKFVRHLLRKVGLEPSPEMRHNLKHIKKLAWLKSPEGILDYLDNSAQLCAVQLIMSSGVSRKQAFGAIEHLLLHGKPGGKREAAQSLGAFNGAEANALALKALDDPDPQIQASILMHMRERGIPGILPRLMEYIESPHLEVRRAAQHSLADFSFTRFLGSFDMLEEEVQRSTGMMVKKIDPQTWTLLREELRSGVTPRRIKGLRIVRALDAAERMQPEIIELLHDGDYNVRCEAAMTLAGCDSPAGREALEAALHDVHQKVREAAVKSLEEKLQFGI